MLIYSQHNLYRFDYVQTPNETLHYLHEISSIFISKVFKECRDRCNAVESTTQILVKLIVHTNISDITWNTDESYKLNILTSGNFINIIDRVERLIAIYVIDILGSNDFHCIWNIDDQVSVKITGYTVFGVRHGLETLNQLITDNVCGPGLLLVDSVRIEDRPNYRHRGVLLDTARNFLPVSVIKRTIAGAAASKLNVLHWHITDTQSFPLGLSFLYVFF